MDLDTLTDEVVRRLMIKIQQERDASPQAGSTAATSDTNPMSSCCSAPDGKKLVITDAQAAAIARGSQINFPKGTIITPLARDTFKDRGISYGFDN